jgi:hypothetical protein
LTSTALKLPNRVSCLFSENTVDGPRFEAHPEQLCLQSGNPGTFGTYSPATACSGNNALGNSALLCGQGVGYVHFRHEKTGELLTEAQTRHFVANNVLELEISDTIDDAVLFEKEWNDKDLSLFSPFDFAGDPL